MALFIRRFRMVFLLAFLLAIVPLWGRDWVKDPPWIEIPSAARVAAIGDVHGGLPELIDTLRALQVAVADKDNPTKLKWCGADTILVFTGDYGDRGEYTKEVYDAVMDLEAQAPLTGGRVIALFGNHEALLLNGQVEKWAKTLKPPKKQHYQNTITSLERSGMTFHQAISKTGTYGAWIRRRPLFALINGYLFLHGGLAKPPITRSEMAAEYREGVEAESWNKSLFMNEDGPIWHREWWNDEAFVEQALQVVGARGVIFGHTIGALGTPGKIGVRNQNMINIDIGMTPAYGNSKGGGLLISILRSGNMAFRARYPNQPEEILFQCPAPIPVSTPRSATGR
jgi:hypothetical protein